MHIDWTPIIQGLIDKGPRIAFLLIAGFVTIAVLRRFLPSLVRRMLVTSGPETKRGLEKRTETLVRVLGGTAEIVIIIIVVLTVLDILTVPIAPILAGFGIVGIAVSFGAQYLVRDLIAGVFIILENQYRVGDIARVASVQGVVEEISLRKTVIRDGDDVVHHVPNGEIRVASNLTRHHTGITLNVSVSYRADIDKAIKVIDEAARAMADDAPWKDHILTAPKVLRVDNLSDTGVEIRIAGEVVDEPASITGELRLRIKKALDNAGIEMGHRN